MQEGCSNFQCNRMDISSLTKDVNFKVHWSLPLKGGVYQSFLISLSKSIPKIRESMTLSLFIGGFNRLRKGLCISHFSFLCPSRSQKLENQ